MMANTIISANNVLKRTTSFTLFSCIIYVRKIIKIDVFELKFNVIFKCTQGLERVIISNTITKYYHEKIERLALELVKLEYEQFSLLALKLLVTCMYIGKCVLNSFIVNFRNNRRISLSKITKYSQDRMSNWKILSVVMVLCKMNRK